MAVGQASKSHLLFELDNQDYAVRADLVKAIGPRSGIRVPAVKIDSSPFGLETAGGPDTLALHLADDERSACLLVDRIGEVIAIPQGEIESTLNFGPAHLKNVYKGIYRVQQKVIVIVNPLEGVLE